MKKISQSLSIGTLEYTFISSHLPDCVLFDVVAKSRVCWSPTTCRATEDKQDLALITLQNLLFNLDSWSHCFFGVFSFPAAVKNTYNKHILVIAQLLKLELQVIVPS